MNYTNIKKQAKAAVLARLEADAGYTQAFKDVQKIVEFSNVKKINSKRVLIGASANPNIVGDVVIGWMVDVIIQVASDFNNVSSDEHEEICSNVEAFIEDTANTTELTNASFVVQVSTPGVSPDDDFENGERISEYHLELDCFLTGS